MPAYNCEKYIEEAIQSILKQSYKNFELLIADDCSTDNTKGIINRLATTDSRIKTFHNSENQGYLMASNLLLDKCEGEFITFQDADDFSRVDRLEKLLDALSNDPYLYCVGSNTFSFMHTINEGKSSSFPSSYKEIVDNYVTKIVMTGSALMIRKEVLLLVGKYNPFFNRIGSEDIYWYGRIIEKFKTINLPEVLYYYRQNPTSVSRTHTNVNSLISYEICIQSFLNRKAGKRDLIMEGTDNEKLILCQKLLAEYYIKKGQTKKAYDYLIKLLPNLTKLDYLFFRLFARQTIYNLFKI